MHFAVLYRWIGIHFSGSPEQRLQDFGSAFYFSVVTWTTLGYGDIVPSVEAWPIVIIETTLGYLVMALLIATMIRLRYFSVSIIAQEAPAPVFSHRLGP